MTGAQTSIAIIWRGMRAYGLWAKASPKAIAPVAPGLSRHSSCSLLQFSLCSGVASPKLAIAATAID